MQKVVDNRNLVLPSPYFALIHDNNGDKFITFSSINEGEDVVTEKLPGKLANCSIKDIQLEFGNWLIVCEEHESMCQHFLWNIHTMEDPIYFPDYELKAEHEIKERILTAPPGNPDCKLVLFEKTKDGTSLSYCKEGEECWTNHVITDRRLNLTPHWGLLNPVVCNGKIYRYGWGYEEMNYVIVVIDIKPDCLVLDVSEVLLTPRFIGMWNSSIYLVESCGDLCMVRLTFSEKNEEREVCDVQVLKLNSQGEWQRLESFEDRAFFVGSSFKFSCHATGSIKGNHVYFTLLDKSSKYYSFNMEAQTVVSSVPRSCPVSALLASFWVKPDLRPSDIVQIEKHIGKFKLDGAKEDIKSRNQEILKQFAIIEGDFDKLPLELRVDIGRRLPLHDYMSFRFLNSMFKEVAPLTRWKQSNLKRFEGNIPSPALLMTCRTRNDVWNLIDPFHKERYFLTRNDALGHATICYSKEGWCMLAYKSSVFLWNPFIKKTIPLPDLPYCSHLGSCSFSSLPDSPEPDCTILVGIDLVNACLVSFIKLGDKEWSTHYFRYTSNFGKMMTMDKHCLVFSKETFYFLDEKGNLGVYKNNTYDGFRDENGDPFKVLNYVVKCPHESFHRGVLLECDNKILSVFLDFGGQNVQVFELDESNMTWSSVESIGNHTIYLSRFSSFSTSASLGIHDRIYFSRYCNKGSLVYYSLESRKLHSHINGEVLKDFYTTLTEEQTICGWVTPLC